MTSSDEHRRGAQSMIARAADLAHKPSLDLLRTLSDELVLRAVLTHGKLIRAEMAAHTGLSKPTVSESVRRLVAAGLLVQTGERTTGRGRAGSYFTIDHNVGAALVCAIHPNEVTAQSVDPFGSITAEVRVPLEHQTGADLATRALHDAVARVCEEGRRPLRLAVVSVADPVDRSTGRVVHLRDAPFLVGDLDPVQVLATFVPGPVQVDNDVNWVARAQRKHPSMAHESFVYIHLGEGLGGAAMIEGEVAQGHHGFAGEIAHLVVEGPYGRAMPFTEVFATLGLRRNESNAVDVDRLLADLDRPCGQDETLLAVIARAVAGVVAASVALLDPARVILGGSWGGHQDVLGTTAEVVRMSPRPVPLAGVPDGDGVDIEGARDHALQELRSLLIAEGHGKKVSL